MNTPRLLQVSVRRCAINLPHEFSMDKPDPSHPVPVHLCSPEERANAIREAGKERVQAYHEMGDQERIGARYLVMTFVQKFGADEVRLWVDEGEVSK